MTCGLYCWPGWYVSVIFPFFYLKSKLPRRSLCSLYITPSCFFEVVYIYVRTARVFKGCGQWAEGERSRSLPPVLHPTYSVLSSPFLFCGPVRGEADIRTINMQLATAGLLRIRGCDDFISLEGIFRFGILNDDTSVNISVHRLI